MGKVIIVEGCDNTGKSTLIAGLRKLITNPKLLCIHSATPPKGVDQYQWSYDYYNQLLYMSKYLAIYSDFDIILDRAHLGETVYGPLYRKYDASYIWDLEKKHIQQEITHLIVLFDTPENILNRDDGLSLETVSDEYVSTSNAFKCAFETSCIKHKQSIDVSKGFADAQKIMEWINETN